MQYQSFDDLLNRKEELFDLLRRLVEIETPSRDAESIAKCVSLIKDELKEVANITNDIDTPNGPIVSFQIPAKKPVGKKVLMLCHLDTVYAKGTWGEQLYKNDSVTIWGPGVFDMKGGTVQSIFVLKMLAQISDKLTSPVELLLTPDEEIGSVESKNHILEEAKASACVLIPEPSLGINGALKTSRSGRAQYRLKIYGLSSHSGLDPLKGASAIKELAIQVCELYKTARPQEGLHINVGLIKGGTAVNVVADYAEAIIDVRVIETNQLKFVEEAVASMHVTDPRVTMTIEGGLERPPWKGEPEGGELFKSAKQIASRMGIILETSHAGGGSDGNFTGALGLPTLDGLGPIGLGAHSLKNECINAISLIERTALLYEIVKSIATKDF